MIRTCWLMVMLGLGACDTSEKSDDTAASGTSARPGDDDGDDSASQTGDDTGETIDPSLVTWYADVQPIMQRHCIRCHNEDGLGVGDFRDRVVVDAMAEIMLGRIDAGEMPPPVSDPECRSYVGSEHLSLSPETRDVFDQWIEDGKLEGDPETAPVVDPILIDLEAPDLVLRPAWPYTPLYENEAEPGNEYRCFALDPGRDETFYITALAPILDKAELIHHLVLFSKNIDSIADDELGADGYDCIGSGMTDGVYGMLAGWAPGGLPVEFPEGQGFAVGPNDRLILQIHYYQSGPDLVGMSDQTGFAFRTTDSVDKQVMLIPFTNFIGDFRIPAGDEAYTYSFEYPLPIPVEVSILGTFPHMHRLGTGYRMWARSGGTEECLVESDHYDFDNQLMYMFDEPLTVSLGDTLGFECTWNNSTSNPDLFHDPPIDVEYGERTDEEMCFAFTLVSY